MTELGDEESWAQACLQHALPEFTVGQHGDGTGPGMYDLTVIYPDSIGAVEITAADVQQIRLWKLIGGRVKRWLEPGVVGGWQVRVLPSARARNLHSQVPDLLRKPNTTAIAREWWR
jgi:hypothetical protein